MQRQAKSHPIHPGLNTGITVHTAVLCECACVLCVCVSPRQTRQESHISWSQTSYFSTPPRLSLPPPSSPNSVIIFCQRSFSSFRLTTKIHLFSSSLLPRTSKNCQENSEGTGEGFESERAKDGRGWLGCGDLAGDSIATFKFCGISIVQEREREVPSDKDYELNRN